MGAGSPQVKVAKPKAPQDGMHRASCTDSLLESQSLPPTYGIENVARVRINGESYMAPLNNGVWIYTIMLGFVKNHSLR